MTCSGAADSQWISNQYQFKTDNLHLHHPTQHPKVYFRCIQAIMGCFNGQCKAPARAAAHELRAWAMSRRRDGLSTARLSPTGYGRPKQAAQTSIYACANPTFSLADVLSMLLDLFISQGGSSFKTVPCCFKVLRNGTPWDGSPCSPVQFSRVLKHDEEMVRDNYRQAPVYEVPEGKPEVARWGNHMHNIVQSY